MSGKNKDRIEALDIILGMAKETNYRTDLFRYDDKDVVVVTFLTTPFRAIYIHLYKNFRIIANHRIGLSMKPFMDFNLVSDSDQLELLENCIRTGTISLPCKEEL